MAATFANLLDRGDSMARAALSWWVAELRGCVPVELRRRLSRPRRILDLNFSDRQVDVVEESSAGRRELMMLPISSDRPALGPSAGNPLPRGLGRGYAEIRAILPENAFLRRRVELPLAAARQIDEAIELEIDRLTPFKADDAVFAARIVERDFKSGRLLCDLVVAPRRQILEIQDWAAAAGIALKCVYGRGESGELLLLAELPLRAAGRRKARFRPAWLLALLAAGFAVASFMLHLDREQNILDAYLTEIARARGEAAKSSAARDQIVLLAASFGRLQSARASQPLSANLLGELTRLLPDDSWLTELHLAEGRLSISGYSASAAALVPVIDASAMFQATRLSAPVTADTRLGRERFSIESSFSPAVAK